MIKKIEETTGKLIDSSPLCSLCTNTSKQDMELCKKCRTIGQEHVKEPDVIFCKDCKFYIPSTFRSGLLLSEYCTVPKNITDTHHGRWVKYLDVPESINANNDCTWFERLILKERKSPGLFTRIRTVLKHLSPFNWVQ